MEQKKLFSALLEVYILVRGTCNKLMTFFQIEVASQLKAMVEELWTKCTILQIYQRS